PSSAQYGTKPAVLLVPVGSYSSATRSTSQKQRTRQLTCAVHCEVGLIGQVSWEHSPRALEPARARTCPCSYLLVVPARVGTCSRSYLLLLVPALARTCSCLYLPVLVPARTRTCSCSHPIPPALA